MESSKGRVPAAHVTAQPAAPTHRRFRWSEVAATDRDVEEESKRGAIPGMGSSLVRGARGSSVMHRTAPRFASSQELQGLGRTPAGKIEA